MNLMFLFKLSLLLFCCLSTQAFAKTEVWVYTSIYKEFIAPIEAEFEKKYPDIDGQFRDAQG